MSRYKILVALSGSIACFKTCALISSLVQEGHEVRCIATKGALEFIGKASLEGISANPVLASTFEEGRMMDHIHLVDWCDATIVYPASASLINRLSAGFGEDPLMAFYLAYDWSKPFLLAPSMNDRMLMHPKVQKSLKELQEIGVTILDPESGFLACRKVGKGRVCSPETAHQSLLLSLAPKKNLKVLVTAGGTEEPIDSVRSITNKSSGETGITIANELIHQGYQVDTLFHKQMPKLHGVCLRKNYQTYSDFHTCFEYLVKAQSYDVIVHAAACSDYSVVKDPSEAKERKISSSQKHLELQLKKNPKLLNMIKSDWGFSGCLISFKLTVNLKSDEIERKVQEQMNQSASDLLVQNDLLNITKDKHIHTIYGKNGKATEGSNKIELSQYIANYINQEVHS